MQTLLDETHEPGATSWVADANGHAGFPIQNLPLARMARGERESVVTAIGEHALDLRANGGEAHWKESTGSIRHDDEQPQPFLQSFIGQPVCPGLAFGEREDFSRVEQSGFRHLFLDLANSAAMRATKSGRPAQRKCRAVSMAM